MLYQSKYPSDVGFCFLHPVAILSSTRRLILLDPPGIHATQRPTLTYGGLCGRFRNLLAEVVYLVSGSGAYIDLPLRRLA